MQQIIPDKRSIAGLHFKGFASILFKKRSLILLICLFAFSFSFGQNVGISASSTFTPDASAGLDISYASKGLLIPRVALTASNVAGPIASPAISLLVYNTVSAGSFPNGVVPGFYYWNGIGWSAISTSSTDWLLSGNSGTTPGSNFLGTTDATDFVLKTNNSERLRVGSAGNVGIGGTAFSSTNPEQFLVDAGTTAASFNLISGKGSINNYLQLNIQNGSSGASASADLVATNDAGSETANFIDMGINSSGNAGTTATNVTGGANTAYLYATGNDFAIGNESATKNLIFFTGSHTGSTERMRIDGNGKVSIGVSATGVQSALGSDFTLFQSANSVASRGFRLTGNSIGNVNSGTGFSIALGYNTLNNKQLWMGDPDQLNVAAGTFVRYSVSNGNVAILDAIAGDNSVRRPLAIGFAGDVNSAVILGSDNSATTPSSFVWNNGNMAIGSGYRANAAPANGLLVQGNVGIGTTAPASKLSVAGSITPATDNIYSLGSSTLRWQYVYTSNLLQVSDRRMKTNIKPLNYGLKEVLRLNPVSYNWKDKPNKEHKVGLIAQEVRQLVPEVVVGDEAKETLAMNYAELVPVLINAIKEQQKQLQEMQTQINQLQSGLNKSAR